MSTEENKAVARSFFATMDRAKGGAPLDLLTPELAVHVAGSPQDMNLEAFQEFSRAFYASFPDLAHTVEDQVAEGDKVVNRLTIRGTHRGEFQGIPATGRPVTLEVVSIQRIAGGKVAEQWIGLDALGMLQQLGAIPAQEEHGL